MLPVLLFSALIAAPDQIDWKHPYGNAVKLIDGGICVGLAWVKLLPGEVATVDYGPDFNVYRVCGPAKAVWGAYSGFAGQSTPDIRHVLLNKDGVSVFRGTRSDGFDGYFVGEPSSQQNHFFGTMFKDSPGDSAFFARVRFGAAASAKCKLRHQ